MTDRLYLTTAIPFVNGSPHLGHALEYVQTDVFARHARARAARSGSSPAPTSTRRRTCSRRARPARKSRPSWPANARAVPRARRLARRLLRRLPPHERRPAPPARRSRRSGAGARPPAICTAIATSAGTARGAKSSASPTRRPAAGARSTTRRSNGSRRRTGSSGLSRYRDALTELIAERAAAHRARSAPQRGARVPRRAGARRQRVPAAGAGPRLGHPGSRRSRPRRSTCGSTR